MKLDQLGKVGEFCNDASVPIITGKEKIIGFRQLAYVFHAKGILKKVVLPRRAGWVYLTDRRILHLDDGWVTKDGAQWKRYEEVAFEETLWVRHKRADKVWVDVLADGKKYAIAYQPYGAAARLFSWLLKEKETRRKFGKGELESVYAKERWYRHPPK
jgi:hypothetical protein